MPTIKVVDVLQRISLVLQDTLATRYTTANLLKFLNDGQREVVLHRPDANITTATFACADGSKQELPSVGLRLVEVIRNVNGNAVTQVDRTILDQNLPNWHETLAGAKGIEHFVYETVNPKSFYIYPKGISGTHSLEIVYSSIPTVIPAVYSAATTISLDDVYANCLIDYVLYRAYQIDSDEGNLGRSGAHFQAFAQSLGIKTKADAAASPRPTGV